MTGRLAEKTSPRQYLRKTYPVIVTVTSTGFARHMVCDLRILVAIFGVISMASCTGSSSAPDPNAQGSEIIANQLPSALLGVWTREWIRRPGVAVADQNAVQDSPLVVRYLQTPEFFGDMRIPVDRPD